MRWDGGSSHAADSLQTQSHRLRSRGAVPALPDRGGAWRRGAKVTTADTIGEPAEIHLEIATLRNPLDTLLQMPGEDFGEWRGIGPCFLTGKARDQNQKVDFFSCRTSYDCR